ncbi:hypothetical protein GCM10009642_52350 [Nocardiopsis metallicus]
MGERFPELMAEIGSVTEVARGLGDSRGNLMRFPRHGSGRAGPGRIPQCGNDRQV